MAGTSSIRSNPIQDIHELVLEPGEELRQMLYYINESRCTISFKLSSVYKMGDDNPVRVVGLTARLLVWDGERWCVVP